MDYLINGDGLGCENTQVWQQDSRGGKDLAEVNMFVHGDLAMQTGEEGRRKEGGSLWP